MDDVTRRNAMLLAATAGAAVAVGAATADDKKDGDKKDGEKKDPASMVGRRVKVFLSDGQILGTIKSVQGSQILLSNVFIPTMAGIDSVLIDTSSGMFSKLAFLHAGMLDADPDADIILRAEVLAAERKADKKALDKFVVAELENARRLRAASDLPYDQSVLNPLEKELFRQHPFDGLNACLAAKAALNRSQARYQAGCLHNGNGDAFRHALWNALMTKKIGAAMAKRWGDAHEEGANPPSPPLEKEMDLFNNEVGRGIALTTTDDPAASDAVRAKIRAGAMKRIVGNQLVATNGDCEL